MLFSDCDCNTMTPPIGRVLTTNVYLGVEMFTTNWSQLPSVKAHDSQQLTLALRRTYGNNIVSDSSVAKGPEIGLRLTDLSD